MPFFLSVLMAVQAITWREAPAGSVLHIRLTGAVGSYASRPGSPIEGVLIAPVKVDGETVLPSGSILSGTVKSARRVGFGIIHESASLDLTFDSISLPGGGTRHLTTQLAAVDNSREEVTPTGSIREVRSTGSWGNRAAHYLQSIMLLDVHAQLMAWAVKSVVIQIPEPEIYLPSGTELTLVLPKAERSYTTSDSDDETRTFTQYERASLAPVISDLPSRAFTPPTKKSEAGKPADLVNLLFIGSREQIAAAFTAAGWTEARPTSFRAVMSVSLAAMFNRNNNHNGPMSAMRVNNAAPDMSWQKGFNDVGKRHHVRLWKLDQTWEGQELWAGAGTRDVEWGYLRGAVATHRVEEHVDHERDKVAYDIAFASCADVLDWMDRPDGLRMTRNATGDRMQTDGQLAVVQMNDCSNPRRMAAGGDTLPVHGKLFERLLRREILTARNDLIRGNIYWKAYEGIRSVVFMIQNRRQPPELDAAPQQTLASRLQPSGLNSIVSFR
ncbi:MAG TPA: LssY C-terminal domain-containing protein [Bryobacteraceae bacterium]|jgi:hypothetical protein